MAANERVPSLAQCFLSLHGGCHDEQGKVDKADIMLDMCVSVWI